MSVHAQRVAALDKRSGSERNIKPGCTLFFVIMSVHGYSLQIKNSEDSVDHGDGQLVLSLLATVFHEREREPVIGAVVHPLRVSFCFVYLNFMTLFCTYGAICHLNCHRVSRGTSKAHE